MRRTWWTGVPVPSRFLALVLALWLGLALVPLGAGAAAADPADPAPPAATWFAVELVVDGLPEVSGTSMGFAAGLRADSDSPALVGAQVTLLGREHGSTTYRALAEGITDQNGAVRVNAVLHRTTALRWRYAGSEGYAATTSDAVVNRVAARVSAHARDSSVTRAQKVVVGGRAGPDKVGQHVSLWMGQIPVPLSPAPAPLRIANAVVGPDGTFRLSRRFHATGSKQLFVKVNHGRGTTEGYSGYFRVRVR
ncbi:MAG: hypothetical protein JWQ74_2707 [Marmoricola sp.]|nr:hypothetical protein [Marmoricola sp.]